MRGVHFFGASIRQATAQLQRTAGRAAAASPQKWRRELSTVGESSLKRTPLFELHKQHQALMVPFAGYSMPVKYANMGPLDAHQWVRKNAGIFDVSHMVQWSIKGPGSTAMLEYATPSGIGEMALHTSTLSVLTNAEGGIVDDLMITRHGDEEYYVVTNAACREKDTAHLMAIKQEFPEVQLVEIVDKALVAVQGPLAVDIVSKCTPYDLSTLKFGMAAYTELYGVPVHIARGGYTGEDGVEISIPADSASEITARLLASSDKVSLIGLGARDSLRLEAGMCLYGHDLDDTTSPVEAALSWVIPKSRRETGGFLGAEHIQAQLANGVTRRRVGLFVDGPAAREGSLIFDEAGLQQVGVITSGAPSPTLGRNIAMGYVAQGHHKSGTRLQAQVRNKMRPAQVTRMPFVASKYYR